MFTRVSGTTTIAASGRSVGEPARVREPGAVPPAQADAAEDGAARGCRRAPRAAGRASSTSSGEASRPATASPATRPAAIVAARRAEPALERDAVDEAEACGRRPARRARTRAARGARCSAAARRRPRPRASTTARRRPASTSSSFQRSSAAPAQSKPGPRFAVVAGARTTSSAHRPTSARIASRLASITVAPSVSTSTAAVSFRPWPVRTTTTVLPGSSSTCESPA